MVVHKLMKGDYRCLPLLLKRIGAVRGKTAYPQFVYVSELDYKKIRAGLTAEARKSYRSKHVISNVVGMELLNLGPNERLARVIRPGYVLVDDAGMAGAMMADSGVY